MGSDAVIIHPQVEIIKDENGELLEDTAIAAVMTCAAPMINYGLEGMTQQQYEAMVYKRITGMLKVAAYLGYRYLVLGAFGCGAFRNDARIVSDLFYRALKEFDYDGIEVSHHENPAPDHGDRRRGDDHGQEIDAAVDVPAPDLSVQQGGEDQREQHAHWYGKHHVQERVDGRTADHIILKEFLKVFEAHIDFRPQSLGFVEAAPDGVEKRIDIQDAQADNGRRDEDKGGNHDLGIIALAAAEARRSSSG
jgi:hypothetical protein